MSWEQWVTVVPFKSSMISTLYFSPLFPESAGSGGRVGAHSEGVVAFDDLAHAFRDFSRSSGVKRCSESKS